VSEDQFESRLEESRDVMKDLALPPGYGLGRDQNGQWLVVKEATSEVFAVDGTEEDLPSLVIDLWREYVVEAPPAVMCRFIHSMTAVDALLSWKGELSGGPRDRVVDDDLEEVNYQCFLWGKDGNEGDAALGWDNDPINAVLKARRVLLESLEEQDEGDDGCTDDSSAERESHEPQEG
jgi:hypothetical protein